MVIGGAGGAVRLVGQQLTKRYYLDIKACHDYNVGVLDIC